MDDRIHMGTVIGLPIYSAVWPVPRQLIPNSRCIFLLSLEY